MLRAIFFLDCDYCHESHSAVRVKTSTDTFLSYVEGELEESALEDGWCHCLDEDTGKYRLMCCDCHATVLFRAEQCDSATFEVEF